MWSKYAEYSIENIGSENVISIKKKKKLFFPSKGLKIERNDSFVPVLGSIEGVILIITLWIHDV